jgi:hypothetical protein
VQDTAGQHPTLLRGVCVREPFRIVWAKVPFFNMICPLCANVSETEAKTDVEEANRVDATDADPVTNDLSGLWFYQRQPRLSNKSMVRRL